MKEKKATKREVRLAQQWATSIISFNELKSKLKKTKVGALSTIARVYRHEKNQE